MLMTVSVPLASTFAAAVLAVLTAPTQPAVLPAPAQPESWASAESMAPCHGCHPGPVISDSDCTCNAVLDITNPGSGDCTGTSPVCGVHGNCSATVGVGWEDLCATGQGAKNFSAACFGNDIQTFLCPGGVCPCAGGANLEVTLTCTPCQ